MTYWLDLFTGQTWEEFQRHGANVSGFRKRMHNAVERMKRGDVLLCDLTGVMRWVGALEVQGRSEDTSAIWQFDTFPERLNVKPLILLPPEHGVPMGELESKVDFYRSAADRPGYNGFLRMSPNRFKREADAELILLLLRAAHDRPKKRPVDPKKLARKPFYKAESKRGKQTITTVVTVPDADEVPRQEPTNAIDVEKSVSTTRHTEIQYALLSSSTQELDRFKRSSLAPLFVAVLTLLESDAERPSAVHRSLCSAFQSSACSRGREVAGIRSTTSNEGLRITSPVVLDNPSDAEWLANTGQLQFNRKRKS